MNAFEFFDPFLRNMLTAIPLVATVAIGVIVVLYSLRKILRKV